MKSQTLHKLQQKTQPQIRVRRSVLARFLVLAILCLFGLTSLLSVPSASAKEIQKLPHEPKKPKVLQVYFNTTDKREYIYNGEEWVPHDASIDTYVLKKYKKPKLPRTHSNGNGVSNNTHPSDNQGGAK